MWKNGVRILFILSIIILLIACQNSKTKEHDLLHLKSESNGKQKKVMLLMVDSLMAQSIDEGIRQKQLPAFEYLIEHGQYYKDVVTSFPTMSVTIDSSFITGKYPDAHHVPGLIWYSADDRRLINYGTGPMEMLRQGLDKVLIDSLLDLNGKHLSQESTTIYEDLNRLGLTSGSVNGLIYRGNTDHTLSIPEWIQGISPLQNEMKVKGPDFLAFGALANPLEERKDLPDDVTDRMGFNNNYTVEVVKYLIQSDKLPDFLYVYLPDLDQQLHKKGPSDLQGVKVLDRQLDSILQTFGSREKALNEVVIILLGDSGMTHILPSDQNPVVDLTDLFKGANILRPGETVSEKTDIALAVNETMAYVYKFNANDTLRDIADVLKIDDRINFVAWKEQEWVHAVQGGTFKELKYKASGNWSDPYGQRWTIEQDVEVFDLKANADDQTLHYGKYPDVLQRLLSSLNSHQGEFLVATARPGYEFSDRSSPTHKGGGGHGSIGHKESLVPLIITGTDQKPQHLRMIDMKRFVLELLTKNIQKTG